MIVWLASFPRSGNALTRFILQSCFGARNNHVPPGKLSEAREAGAVWFAKTHETDVPEDEPAICIIRDGRAALSSFHRYLRDFANSKVSLERVVQGRPRSWSDHINWILSRDPSNTLVLRYEELIETHNFTLRRIATFTRLPLLRPFKNAFDAFHKANPKMFGVGGNGLGIAEVERECGEVFWRVNGDAMRALGYEQCPCLKTAEQQPDIHPA